jgi:hypothetical protein
VAVGAPLGNLTGTHSVFTLNTENIF